MITRLKNCLKLSLTEFEYAKSHQYIYDELFLACSASEFQLKFAIYGCEVMFTTLDYLVVFAICSSNLKIGNENKLKILLELIDSKFFDVALRNTNFVKRLVLAYRNWFEFINNGYRYQVLAHIFKQYPDYLKMNFMFIKHKKENQDTGKIDIVRKQYFTLVDIDHFF